MEYVNAMMATKEGTASATVQVLTSSMRQGVQLSLDLNHVLDLVSAFVASVCARSTLILGKNIGNQANLL